MRKQNTKTAGKTARVGKATQNTATATKERRLQEFLQQKSEKDLLKMYERFLQLDGNKGKQRQKTIEKELKAILQELTARGIINDYTIKPIAERISVKALKTVYAKSGQPFILSLYNGLIKDINSNNEKDTITDGYDIPQTAILFLLAYRGKKLDDITTDGQTDKDGNPITIMRACFRAVNRYIMSERQREYKKVYIDDIDKDGNALYYEIQNGYDIPTATDYYALNIILQVLRLSTKEKQFIKYRLQGIGTEKVDRNGKQNDSIKTIADKMGVKRETLYSYRNRIQDKLKAVDIKKHFAKVKDKDGNPLYILYADESHKKEIIKAVDESTAKEIITAFNRLQAKAREYTA